MGGDVSMNIFDQRLFVELTAEYSKDDLSADDYEELYMRFSNIGHLNEVQPYLLTMRYFGWGTSDEKGAVLSELKEKLCEDNYILKGLYYDLLLSENNNNADALEKLGQMVEEGYTDVFTKEKTHIEKLVIQAEDSSPQINLVSDQIEKADEEVVVDYITFEGGNYSGLYFAAGEIDYLYAKVYIKPFNGRKHIKVRSQIFLDGDEFSKVMSKEYDIDSNTQWFETQGWGNTNYTCYSNNIYKWVVEIDGKTTFGQEFRMYDGKINKIGPKVNDIKLFASKSSGALEKDQDIYKVTFNGDELEYIYFKFLIDMPRENMNVQVFIKIIYLEDETVFRNKCVLFNLNEDTIAFWEGVGFSKSGNWKKGLYKYLVYAGNSQRFDGTFSVY